MLIETFTLVNIYNKIKKKENLGGLDNESIIVIIFTFLWIILWLITLIVAIRCVKSKRCKNPSASLVLSALSWPMFWLFKITNVLC